MAFSESLIAFNETLLVIKPVSSEIRDILLSWIEILIFFLIIILIFSAVVYVLVSLINDTDQLVIMPFITGSKEDKYDGNAISAALICGGPSLYAPSKLILLLFQPVQSTI